MRKDVLAVQRGVPVAADLVETDLQVEDEEHLCWVSFQARGWKGRRVVVDGGWLTELFLSMRSHGTAGEKC